MYDKPTATDGAPRRLWLWAGELGTHYFRNAASIAGSVANGLDFRPLSDRRRMMRTDGFTWRARAPQRRNQCLLALMRNGTSDGQGLIGFNGSWLVVVKLGGEARRPAME